MMVATTRAQRRQIERDNAKQPIALAPLPRDQWPGQRADASRRRVWRSRGFLVQEFDAPAPASVRLSVNRTVHDGAGWAEAITWDELQAIKAQCGYAHHTAVEVYPPMLDEVNVANMRHLWVLAAPLPFAWRRSA